VTEYRSLPTENDMASASRIWFAWRRPKKHWAIMFAVFFATFSTVVLPNLEDEAALSIAIVVATNIALAAVATAVVGGLVRTLVPWRAKKHFRQQKVAHDEAAIGWSDAGFTYKSALITALHPWTYYRAWGENKDVLVMFLTNVQFNVVPKRDIPDAALDELRMLLAKAGIPAVGKKRAKTQAAFA